MRRRRYAHPSEPCPGSIVIYRGSDIGVVERIDHGGAGGTPTLHVRGGISGSLRSIVPATALAAVEADTRRYLLDDHLRFE